LANLINNTRIEQEKPRAQRSTTQHNRKDHMKRIALAFILALACTPVLNAAPIVPNPTALDLVEFAVWYVRNCPSFPVGEAYQFWVGQGSPYS